MSEDDCSASNPKCKKPTGKQVKHQTTKTPLCSDGLTLTVYCQVHWVQCDKCELWYHLFCIGLRPADIKEDEDFNCKTCKPGGHKQQDSSASDMDTE